MEANAIADIGDTAYEDLVVGIIFDKGTEDEYTARVLMLTNTEFRIVQTIEFEEEEPIDLEVRYTR